MINIKKKEILKVRSTGFQCPWHPYQILSYFLISFTALTFPLFIIPMYKSTDRVILIILFFAELIPIIFYALRLTMSNPTDPEVLRFRSEKNPKIPQNLGNREWCDYCESFISNEKSKHCLRCNRCVLNFDHHCKFVNNCVGEKNYRLFVKLIIFVQVFHFFVMVFEIKFLLETGFSVADLVVYADLVICAFIILLNGYLIFFHIFIYFKKISTFEFIEIRRVGKKVRPNEEEQLEEKPASAVNGSNI